ncbi:hypothetical protein TNCV_4999491 [Trichonephila clavipes]|nr:hypothetical protein TNCV_4999491 [Trichonephila clavipes]
MVACTVSVYSEPAGATSCGRSAHSSISICLSCWVFGMISSSTARVQCGPCIVIHKNEVWANDTSEQTHMGKKRTLPYNMIPIYRPHRKVELSSPVQRNASPRQEPWDHRSPKIFSQEKGLKARKSLRTTGLESPTLYVKAPIR